MDPRYERQLKKTKKLLYSVLFVLNVAPFLLEIINTDTSGFVLNIIPGLFLAPGGTLVSLQILFAMAAAVGDATLLIYIVSRWIKKKRSGP